jgi:3-methyladenine DNA glycosylase AlkD
VVADSALVRAARAGLAERADPVKAPGMQRYMKSEMPFRGVQKPARAALANRLFAEHPLPDPDTWVATALDLWRRADYREERLLSLDLLGHRAYAHWQQPGLLAVYEEFVVSGAWWDYVDEIATHHIGPLLRAHPARLAPVMRAWAHDQDRWKRRTSIICQVGAKRDTDTDLLTACIEANIADQDFFLRKAIGWALRAHAKTDPGWVRAFVDTHPGLSPLSRREATKHL